jgi:hypothetical protein
MPTCPHCKAAIPLADVNVQENVALCRACDKALLLTELADGAPLGPTVDPTRPPPGAWFQDDGQEMRVGGTTRHWGALILVPFTCVWSGGSMFGIYGSQIMQGKFNPFLCLFGLPFLIGSIVLWSAVLMSIGGKVEITLRGDEGRIFTGIGSFGIRRRFLASQISRVYEDRARWTGLGSNGFAIVLEGQTRLKLGEGLNEPRRHFVAQMLRTLIVDARTPARS